MALVRRVQTVRYLHQSLQVSQFSYLIYSSRNYSTCLFNAPKTTGLDIYSCYPKGNFAFPGIHGGAMTLHSTKVSESWVSSDNMRSMSTQAHQMGAIQVYKSSPEFICEPYEPREPISFWKRCFTRNGWRRTKEDMIIELKSAYAIAKLRKSGYSKQKFYLEAIEFYKEINASIAHGDMKSLRKSVTEKMYSVLKNEIKGRESMWSKVSWEMVEPVVKIRTLRARLIGVDPKDLNKVFVQLTLEFLTKQKFEAYDSKGTVVAGDKAKEILVRDIWVFEKSLFHPGASWRLCGKIVV